MPIVRSDGVSSEPGKSSSAPTPGGSPVIIKQAAPAGIGGSDFTTEDITKRQAVALLFGDSGQGKTTFLTKYAPDPVALINFDNRDLEAVRKARAAGRKIYRAHIDLGADPSRLDIEAAMKLGQTAVSQVKRNIEWAVRESLKGNIRTIGLDTGTELGEIMEVAVKGRTGGKAKDYGAGKNWVNQAWWNIFKEIRRGSAHFIVLARAKEIWEGGEPTGQFTFRGPEVISDAADWSGCIRLKKTRGIGGIKKVGGAPTIGGTGADGGKPRKEFELQIAKAGINIEEHGEVYTSADWEEYGGPFVYACGLQWPESDAEDWK